MSVNFDHHIKGDSGCQFSQWFWSFKMRQPIAGFIIDKEECNPENYLYLPKFVRWIREILGRDISVVSYPFPHDLLEMQHVGRKLRRMG
jgi:hypothetical protein